MHYGSCSREETCKPRSAYLMRSLQILRSALQVSPVAADLKTHLYPLNHPLWQAQSHEPSVVYESSLWEDSSLSLRLTVREGGRVEHHLVTHDCWRES